MSPGTLQLTSSTPINITRLRSELDNHPDKSFVSYLCHSLKFGFNTKVSPIPTTTHESTNNRSALNTPQDVDELLQKELDKGFLIRPIHTSPFDVYRVSPISVAEHKYSKKIRLIVDLSTPYNQTDAVSINDLTDKDM